MIIAFFLFGIAKLNNFMYVYDPITDTGGMSFPKAIQQLFVGVYFLELCLTGLFFLVRHPDGSGVPCKVQAIFMIVLIILTAIFQFLFYHNVSHIYYNSEASANPAKFHPLVHYLPLDQGQKIRDLNENSTDLECPSKSEWPSSPAAQGASSPMEDRCSTEQDESELETQESSAMAPEYSTADREALLLTAFKHEALRRRMPIIWLPEDDLGIAKDEISRMPATVPASCVGAKLGKDGKVVYETDPPDFVRSDYALL